MKNYGWNNGLWNRIRSRLCADLLLTAYKAGVEYGVKGRLDQVESFSAGTCMVWRIGSNEVTTSLIRQSNLDLGGK